jgi:hypothetical protein
MILQVCDILQDDCLESGSSERDLLTWQVEFQREEGRRRRQEAEGDDGDVEPFGQLGHHRRQRPHVEDVERAHRPAGQGPHRPHRRGLRPGEPPARPPRHPVGGPRRSAVRVGPDEGRDHLAVHQHHREPRLRRHLRREVGPGRERGGGVRLPRAHAHLRLRHRRQAPGAAPQGAVLPHGLPAAGQGRQQPRVGRADADTATSDAAPVPGGHRRESLPAHAAAAGAGAGALQDRTAGAQHRPRKRR